jgi:MFS family permease
MTDPYWDELGIAWCAVNPEVNVIMPRLKSRLRRQSLLIMAGLAFGLILSVAGFLLGGFTIWQGWATGTWNFITRGIAVVAISGILSVAWWRLLPVRASEYAKALSEMIDLIIARAERMLIVIRLGFVACVVAAVFGLIGTAIRTHISRPPAISPIADLAVLGILALGLFFYGRHARIELKKMKHLKQVLAADRE